jgi:energy-coupling factor transporter ATPase
MCPSENTDVSATDTAVRDHAATDDIIVLDDVVYSYDGVKNALKGVSLNVREGEFVAILGGNGSGKSTLAKHFNALLTPDAGRILVGGLDTSDPANTYVIREHVGMVFQNPDDQLVTSIVEDDVAFGPENLGLPPEQIRERVDEALAAVAMTEHAKDDPMNLSGGQKQRVAIAGILAMRPDIIVLDEPGAMLDPRGRRGIRRVCREMHEAGITVVLITHFMEEAQLADRIIVLHEGELALEGTPREVFSQGARLTELELDLPFAMQVRQLLQERGIDFGDVVMQDELEEALCLSYSNR